MYVLVHSCRHEKCACIFITHQVRKSHMGKAFVHMYVGMHSCVCVHVWIFVSATSTHCSPFKRKRTWEPWSVYACEHVYELCVRVGRCVCTLHEGARLDWR